MTRSMDRRHTESRRRLVDHEKKRIAVRMRVVCAGMPESEFEQLVSRMAEIEIKYRMRREEDLLKD